ncbi:MAG: T9SS type A sorting domain-containing protein, partial [Ferruginibacter sp.]
SDDVQVIIDASLAGIDAGPDQTFCVGSTGPVAIGTAAVGGVTYSWSPALYLSNSTIAQPNFTAVSSSGTFTYTLTATNGTCQGFDAVTINMVEGSFTTQPPSSTKLPTGNTISLTAEATSGTNYQWKKGGVSIDGATTTTLTIPTAELTDDGTYTLTCNSNGCASTSSGAVVDVVVDLYSKSTGNLNLNTSWGVETDGTGNYPTTVTNSGGIYSFNRPDHIYHIVNRATTSTVGNLTFAGTLDVREGATTITASTTLTGGIITRQSGTGTLSGSATSNVSIIGLNGVGGNSNLYFTSGSQTLKDLTLSNSSYCTLQTLLDITAGAGFGTVTVNVGSTLVSNGKLTLKSNNGGTARVAEGSASGNYVVGDVTVERHIPVPNNNGRAWRLLSIPTMGSQTMKQSWQEGQFAGVNPGTGYGTFVTTGTQALWAPGGFDYVTYATSVVTFNESTTNFENITTTAFPIETTSGYFIYIRGDRSVVPGESITTNMPVTLRTKGVLYQGTQSEVPVQSGLFALVGNVYASAINFSQLTRNNIDNAYYTWDPKVVSGNSLGIYQTYSTATGWIPGGGSYSASNNDRIESGQAFFVHASGGSGSVQFTEAAKVGSNRNVFRPATPADMPIMQLRTKMYTVTGGIDTLVDAAATIFGNVYSNDIDENDAVKLGNSGENLGIVRNTKSLVIESKLPVVAEDTLFFNIWNMTKRNYKFEFVPENMAAVGVTAYLKDKYLGTTVPISASGNSTVNFTVTAAAGSYAMDRFSIVFKPAVVLPVNFTHISAYKQNATNVVNWKVEAETNTLNYDVQRSADGRVFNSMGTVSASGLNQYRFVDVQPLSGVNYYRIVSADRDGSRKYSTVVKVVDATVGGSITIAPNPVKGNVVALQLNNQNKGIYALRLVNSVGQVTYSTIINHAGGTAVETLQLPKLMTPGIYQVQLILPDNTQQTQKLIISNSN